MSNDSDIPSNSGERLMFNPEDFELATDEVLDDFDDSLQSRIIARAMKSGEYTSTQKTSLHLPIEEENPNSQGAGIHFTHSSHSVNGHLSDSFSIRRSSYHKGSVPFLLEWTSNDRGISFWGNHTDHHLSDSSLEQLVNELEFTLADMLKVQDTQLSPDADMLTDVLKLVKQVADGEFVDARFVEPLVQKVLSREGKRTLEEHASARFNLGNEVVECSYSNTTDLNVEHVDFNYKKIDLYVFGDIPGNEQMLPNIWYGSSTVVNDRLTVGPKRIVKFFKPENQVDGLNSLTHGEVGSAVVGIVEPNFDALEEVAVNTPEVARGRQAVTKSKLAKLQVYASSI